MIDVNTYRQMHPAKFTQPLATTAEMEGNGIDMNSNEPPSDLFCKLLPATILGYGFHDKKWSKSFAGVSSSPAIWLTNSAQELYPSITSVQSLGTKRHLTLSLC